MLADAIDKIELLILSSFWQKNESLEGAKKHKVMKESWCIQPYKIVRSSIFIIGN